MKIFNWMMNAGDVVGKIGALVTLPTALFAIFIFSSEIWDFVTPPDLTTKIEEATIRCNYVWRDQKAYVKYQKGDLSELTKLCENSELAVSFEFHIKNEDSIERELQNFQVNAHITGFGMIHLKEIQSVEHIIQHGVETNIRKNWHVEKLPAGASAVFEILAVPTTDRERILWLSFKDQMDDGNLKNGQARLLFVAETNGTFVKNVFLYDCVLEFDEEEFAKWGEKSNPQKIQVTDICH